MKPFKLVSLLLVALLALSGCSAIGPQDNKLQIVASTNVWGDLAATIGGKYVSVTSLINNVNKDPHSYEATARDQLAVNEADLVIMNGAGYDDFMQKLVGAGKVNEKVLNISKLQLPIDPAENEHIWYSMQATVQAVIAIASELSRIDAVNKSVYQTNMTQLVASITGLINTESQILTGVSGIRILQTEPLADYMLSEIGFVNATPLALTKAVENETDIPPAALNEALKLIESKQVRFIAVNEQTVSSQVDQLTAAAEAKGVRVVELTEQVPANSNYVKWMIANLDAISAALG
jgi:zinc/manganese transport system substrate-binding protein